MWGKEEPSRSGGGPYRVGMQAGESCEYVANRHGGDSVRVATRRAVRSAQGKKLVRSLASFVTIAACGGLWACSPRIGGSEGVDAANDALRAERETLEEKLHAAELARDEWRAKAEVLAGGENSTKRLLAAIPAVVRIEIDPLSQVEVSSAGAAVLAVAFASLDGRDRFTPMVGELRWKLTAAASEGEEPGILAEGMLDAGAVREAYRSSFLGTRYVIETEVAMGTVRFTPGGGATLWVVFVDAATGREVRGEGAVEVVAAE